MRSKFNFGRRYFVALKTHDVRENQWQRFSVWSRSIEMCIFYPVPKSALLRMKFYSLSVSYLSVHAENQNFEPLAISSLSWEYIWRKLWWELASQASSRLSLQSDRKLKKALRFQLQMSYDEDSFHSLRAQGAVNHFCRHAHIVGILSIRDVNNLTSIIYNTRKGTFVNTQEFQRKIERRADTVDTIVCILEIRKRSIDKDRKQSIIVKNAIERSSYHAKQEEQCLGVLICRTVRIDRTVNHRCGTEQIDHGNLHIVSLFKGYCARRLYFLRLIQDKATENAGDITVSRL